MPHFFAAAYLVSAAPLAGKDKSAGYHSVRLLQVKTGGMK